MKEVPFAIIESARNGDIEAAEYILRHFEGYIASKSLRTHTDENGVTHSFVDEELRCRAETALLESIFKFQYRTPPDDFTL